MEWGYLIKGETDKKITQNQKKKLSENKEMFIKFIGEEKTEVEASHFIVMTKNTNNTYFTGIGIQVVEDLASKVVYIGIYMENELKCYKRFSSSKFAVWLNENLEAKKYVTKDENGSRYLITFNDEDLKEGWWDNL